MDEIESEWICSACNKKNQPYYLYCLYCGKRSENIQTCEKCGKIVSGLYKFCTYCGRDLGYSTAIQNKREKEVATLSIERTIYDPQKRDFIISKPKLLPNVKRWIDKNDPTMYWLVACVNNNFDKPIDVWGIELEAPSTLKIFDARIEGTDQNFNLKVSAPKPWLTSWILGIPHHLGIAIPRKGSKRIYFKLGSDACGISYSITGKVSTPNGEIPIEEKSFWYSCDVNTLDTAIVTDTKGARALVSSVIRSHYTGKEAVRIIDSFEEIIGILNVDVKTRADELKSNLKQLRSLIFEGTLLDKIDVFYRITDQELFDTGYLDSNYVRRTKQFCEEFINDWKGEFLKS